MSPALAGKYALLKEQLAALESLVVAYSGGVDSTFLLKAAVDALGSDRVLAVTAESETYQKFERDEAEANARLIGARHLVIRTEELANPEFASNPPDRCYYCKGELFSKLREMAATEGFRHVADGTNLDDLSDIRPGRTAAKENDVVSPLAAAGLTKDDIRALSRELGLPTWNKPAMACLSSRFPYGTEITTGLLERVAKAEELLRNLGFTQFRVRHHGDIARIEVPRDSLARFLDEEVSRSITRSLKELGYVYVTLDLEGFRSGSMNEVLKS
ncbi:MAG: ATP-dependent sacrificial sulfur transferase LarE [Nitrospirota bacterium]|nr:ATP-dependent sacrificial sulfur transferase LarE [Nitrospirota bacterium]